MNKKHLEKAETLAKRSYRVLVFQDRTTDGDAIYVAVLLEIPGCHSFGYTVQEAMESLESAKVDFIYFMLQDGLPVPEPQLLGQRVRINMSEYVGDMGSVTRSSPSPNAVLLRGQPATG